MRAPAIDVQNLTKTFPAWKGQHALFRSRRGPTGNEVLTGVTLRVAAGEALGLLGANGVGKTTLLEILATLLLPTSGHAWVCGHGIVSHASEVRQLVGYCPADAQSFYPRLTGAANLEFFAVLNGLPPREARERAGAILDLVGLDGARHAPFQRYSEGMKQQLSLARALVADPPVLVLDEPTRSLDLRRQREIRRLLRGTLVDKLGKTLLLVTHSLEEAEAVCDRVAILRRGKTTTVGTLAEVKGALDEERSAGDGGSGGPFRPAWRGLKPAPYRCCS